MYSIRIKGTKEIIATLDTYDEAIDEMWSYEETDEIYTEYEVIEA